MTDGGILANARDLRGEVAPMRLAMALGAWRAVPGGRGSDIDEHEAQMLFGVGLATLDRIAAGEVEPDPALAERIGRVVHTPSERPRAEDPPPPGGSPGPRRDAAAAAARPPLAAEAPEDCGRIGWPMQAEDQAAGMVLDRPAFWLARGDAAPGEAGAFHVEMLLDGCVFRLSQAAARQMIVDLWPLLAIAGEPDRYERQPRLARPQQEA
ncbi:MAG: hypothetical protein QOH04_2600 [Sphingomonadales bacterium]|nr:hypothetical protein [Sphingomonadales bacterium]